MSCLDKDRDWAASGSSQWPRQTECNKIKLAAIWQKLAANQLNQDAINAVISKTNSMCRPIDWQLPSDGDGSGSRFRMLRS